ncbi:hypothetical protein BACFRA24663_07700 [Bacteroides fragilis]
MFTLSDYGNFSIWHPESELCLLTMDTGLYAEKFEVNTMLHLSKVCTSSRPATKQKSSFANLPETRAGKKRSKLGLWPFRPFGKDYGVFLGLKILCK